MKVLRHFASSLVILSLSLSICCLCSAKKSHALSQDIIIGFDFINSPEGYISTLAIDAQGSVKRSASYTADAKKNSTENLQLESPQLQELTKLIEVINSEQLGSEYGYGDKRADRPTYRFRIKRKHAWKQILICNLEEAPKAPDSLWALQRFLVSFATIGIDSQAGGTT